MTRSMNFYRGLALGAGLMYLLDPREGGARRERLRDAIAGALKRERNLVGVAEHDREARTRGFGTSADPMLPDTTDDEAIVERVRAKLGRYVTHPSALRVEARDGSVTLSGPILRGEAEELIGAVSSVRGVREVLNRLEAQDSGDGVPGLEGTGRRGSARASRLSIPMTPGLQLVAGVLGATAVAYGAGRIAARMRDARREELEREMPEYAMLR